MMTVKASSTDICDLTSGKAVTKHVLLRLPHRKCMGKSLISCKCCVKHLNEKISFEIFLVGQGVLQMSQISRSCVIVSMSY